MRKGGRHEAAKVKEAPSNVLFMHLPYVSIVKNTMLNIVAHESTHGPRRNKAKKNQHHTFQPGHPRQYYCVSSALSFGERTNSGVIISHVEVAD